MSPQLSRRDALKRAAQFGLAGSILPAITSSLLAADPAARTNILYIMTDDHAAHALSCYGSRINKTPNLDRIATGGMRFENCFVTNALCGPSRATLLTGKYSHMNGFRDNKADARFDGSQVTFPKLLQKAGYQTGVIGKWHLGSDPTGFDLWSIMPGQGRYIDPVFLENGQRKVIKGYATDVITDKALDFLRTRPAEKPFCLLYHHKAPHREWTPDAKHAQLYEDQDIPLPETFDDDYKDRASAAAKQEMTVERHLTATDLKQPIPPGLEGAALKKWKYQRYIKDYLRCIASVDDNVGRVLDYLETSGLAENTIVVYTSDNGFFLGDHGWFDKRFMYEESMRVPLMVRYPGKIVAGSVSKELVINADFAPTILDFAGVQIPQEMQGRSLAPILAGKPPPDWRKSVYYHYYEFPQPHHVHPHYGVRTDRYKLIHYYTLKEWELFDLQKDPHELKSVYDDPAYAQVRQDMTKELNRLRAELKDADGE
ncbi:MAG TPA: sulfatase [Tepidisphaeraceae bacterium]|jgi:arylsulfatase A-like enzyme|nr:sulfatase [Tepidisphaeraceae bacterium]